eukprot:Unigene13100_Nuclearia_a/m.39700 Unigene13100_Nuclearia_a/g.39700  ORF Unigene13100_Nuclearia_a/g.39700 Unigene13100_Nuclearia_a/m.39700 type:complete len:305 (+) Unigene13100_Nuclearia_a:1246-2160(+)
MHVVCTAATQPSQQTRSPSRPHMTQYSIFLGTLRSRWRAQTTCCASTSREPRGTHSLWNTVGQRMQRTGVLTVFRQRVQRCSGHTKAPDAGCDASYASAHSLWNACEQPLNAHLSTGSCAIAGRVHCAWLQWRHSGAAVVQRSQRKSPFLGASIMPRHAAWNVRSQPPPQCTSEPGSLQSQHTGPLLHSSSMSASPVWPAGTVAEARRSAVTYVPSSAFVSRSSCASERSDPPPASCCAACWYAASTPRLCRGGRLLASARTCSIVTSSRKHTSDLSAQPCVGLGPKNWTWCLVCVWNWPECGW